MKKIANYSAQSFGIEIQWKKEGRTPGAGLLTTPDHTSSAGVLPSLLKK